MIYSFLLIMLGAMKQLLCLNGHFIQDFHKQMMIFPQILSTHFAQSTWELIKLSKKKITHEIEYESTNWSHYWVIFILKVNHEQCIDLNGIFKLFSQENRPLAEEWGKRFASFFLGAKFQRCYVNWSWIWLISFHY